MGSGAAPPLRRRWAAAGAGRGRITRPRPRWEGGGRRGWRPCGGSAAPMATCMVRVWMGGGGCPSTLRAGREVGPPGDHPAGIAKSRVVDAGAAAKRVCAGRCAGGSGTRHRRPQATPVAPPLVVGRRPPTPPPLRRRPPSARHATQRRYGARRRSRQPRRRHRSPPNVHSEYVSGSETGVSGEGAIMEP